MSADTPRELGPLLTMMEAQFEGIETGDGGDRSTGEAITEIYAQRAEVARLSAELTAAREHEEATHRTMTGILGDGPMFDLAKRWVVRAECAEADAAQARETLARVTKLLTTWRERETLRSRWSDGQASAVHKCGAELQAALSPTSGGARPGVA